MRKWLEDLRARAAPPAGGAGPVPDDSAGENLCFALIAGISILVVLSAFLFDSPNDIRAGFLRIIASTSMLLSDYIAIGGPGAA
ncbi:MAG: hypothetical protein PHP02_09915, partial [Eubacteriales bacterium]|nr:hypothetical protein [Eubacteriales bacterium]